MEDSVSLLAFQPGFSPKASLLTHNIPQTRSFSKFLLIDSNCVFIPWDVFSSCIHFKYLIYFFSLQFLPVSFSSRPLSAHSCTFLSRQLLSIKLSVQLCRLLFMHFLLMKFVSFLSAFLFACSAAASVTVMLTIHFVLFMPNKPLTSNTYFIGIAETLSLTLEQTQAFYEKEIQLLLCFITVFFLHENIHNQLLPANLFSIL